jgi:dTDP-D-glucose 4,6-dehydratase
VANIDIAKQLIEIMGKKEQESSLISYVDDRMFNDLRYTIDCAKVRHGHARRHHRRFCSRVDIDSC